MFLSIKRVKNLTQIPDFINIPFCRLNSIGKYFFSCAGSPCSLPVMVQFAVFQLESLILGTVFNPEELDKYLASDCGP